MLRLLLIGTGVWITFGLMAIGSPSAPDDAPRSLTLREADMLAFDISKSLQLIGFQPRYLGALGQPRGRSLRGSGHWAATGLDELWGRIELSLEVRCTKPQDGLFFERVLPDKSVYVSITGAGQDFNDVPVDRVRSKRGASLVDELKRGFGVARELQEEPRIRLSDQELERSAELKR